MRRIALVLIAVVAVGCGGDGQTDEAASSLIAEAMATEPVDQSAACRDAFKAAAAVPGDENADEELHGTLDACDSYAEWLVGLRQRPAALGLTTRAEIDGPMEISNVCYGASGPPCDDARDLGILE